MRAGGLVLAGLLAACAPGPRPAPGPQAGADAARLLDVPLFPDRTDQCGPAALAGVLRFWGKDADMEALKREIYRPSLKGALSVDLLLAAQAHGLSARLLDGTLADLKKEVDAGRPSIVYFNQGLGFLPIGHYAVVVGYDPRRGGVYVNSDARKGAFMSDSSFESRWARGDRWALLLRPSSG